MNDEMYVTISPWTVQLSLKSTELDISKLPWISETQ